MENISLTGNGYNVSLQLIGITSEQWDEAVINSITTKSDKPSSLEKIMMD